MKLVCLKNRKSIITTSHTSTCESLLRPSVQSPLLWEGNCVKRSYCYCHHCRTFTGTMFKVESMSRLRWDKSGLSKLQSKIQTCINKSPFTVPTGNTTWGITINNSVAVLWLNSFILGRIIHCTFLHQVKAYYVSSLTRCNHRKSKGKQCLIKYLNFITWQEFSKSSKQTILCVFSAIQIIEFYVHWGGFSPVFSPWPVKCHLYFILAEFLM